MLLKLQAHVCFVIALVQNDLKVRVEDLHLVSYHISADHRNYGFTPRNVQLGVGSTLTSLSTAQLVVFGELLYILDIKLCL